MKFGRAKGRYTGKLETTCTSCNVIWVHPHPDVTMQLLHLPDETTHLWWECPDCGWVYEQADQPCTQAAIGIGIPFVDWSDIEPDPHTPPTIAEYTQMLTIGQMESAQVGAIMVATAEAILYMAGQ